MLPLKLVRSLIFGETTINNPFLVTQAHHRDPDLDDEDYDSDGTGNGGVHHSHRAKPRTRRRRRRAKGSKTPFLLFVPTKELVTDTYRLATIARDMGMDLYPTPSLSHIIFSYPSSAPSPSSTSSAATSSFPSSWSSVSLLPNDAVPLPFPSLTTASSSLCHLRSFVALSRGLFKLVFIDSNYLTTSKEQSFNSVSNWDCGSFSLFSRVTGDRIHTMDGFTRALAGVGWSLFKTTKNPSPDPGDAPISGRNPIYLFRKVDSRRVRVMRTDGDGAAVTGECRIRELRLPPLDFRNAPLRILQYIVLMTDDIFYLA